MDGSTPSSPIGGKGMIYRVCLRKHVDDRYSFIRKNEWLSSGVNFKKGSNVVIGPNGSGKSTLIDAMACVFCTRDRFTSLTDWTSSGRLGVVHDLMPALDSFDITADFSKRIFQLCTEQAISRRRRDMDFSSQSDFCRLMDTISSSSGEFLRRSISLTISDMFDTGTRFPLQELASMIGASSDEWMRYQKYIRDHSVYASDDSAITLIMDEPDRGLDIEGTRELYSILTTPRSDIQIICTLHNPVLITLLRGKEGVNIIESVDGYLDEVVSYCRGEEMI